MLMGDADGLNQQGIGRGPAGDSAVADPVKVRPHRRTYASLVVHFRKRLWRNHQFNRQGTPCANRTYVAQETTSLQAPALLSRWQDIGLLE